MRPFFVVLLCTCFVLLLLTPTGGLSRRPALGVGEAGHPHGVPEKDARATTPVRPSHPGPQGNVGPINGAYFNETNSSFGGTMQNPLLALNSTSGTLFAADQYHGFLTAVNASNGALLRSVVFAEDPPTGAQVTGLSFLPSSDRLVVSYDWGASGSLLAFDGRTLAPIANLTPFPGYADYPPGKSLYLPSTDELWVQDLDHGALEVLRASDLGLVAILPTTPGCSNGCTTLGLVDVSSHGYVLSETGAASASEVSVSTHAVLMSLSGSNASFVFGLATFDFATNELWVQNFSSSPVREFGLLNATTGAWAGVAQTKSVNLRGLAYDARLHAVLVSERDPARCATNQILWLNGTNGSLLTFVCGPGFPTGAPTSYSQLLAWDTATSSSIVATGPAEGELFSLQTSPSTSFQRLATYPEIIPTSAVFALPTTNGLLTTGTDANGTALRLVNASTGGLLWAMKIPEVDPVAVDPGLGFLYVANGTGAVPSYRISDGSGTGQALPAPPAATTGIAVDAVHHWLYVLSTRPNGTLLSEYALSAAGGAVAAGNLSLPGVAACAWATDAPSGTLAVTSCHLPSTPTGNNVTLVNGTSHSKLASVATGIYPSAVASDGAGNLYIVAATSGSVTVVNATTLASRQVSTPGFAATSLVADTPHGLLLGTVGANLSVRNLTDPRLPPVAVITGPSVLAGVVTETASTAIAAVTAWTAQQVSLVSAETPTIVPDVAVTRGNTTLSVSWRAPANPIGGSSLSYSVALANSSSGGWRAVNVTSALSAELTGLTDGNLYSVQIAAANTAGVGPPSTPVNGTPVGLPYPPSFVTAKANLSDIEVTWGTPVQLDGSPLVGYVLEWATSASGPWSSLHLGVVGAYDVSNASRGSTYYFRVAAMNGVGVGPSTASSPVPFGNGSKAPGLFGTPAFRAGVILGVLALLILAVIAIVRFRRAGQVEPPTDVLAEVEPGPGTQDPSATEAETGAASETPR
ncbi:MAG: fibronectin type III domain-containing protein [Thermoplasmata archaeon]|nr:fibronectin type III domain-containing protein [Thermoplasmata archaeon]